MKLTLGFMCVALAAAGCGGTSEVNTESAPAAKSAAVQDDSAGACTPSTSLEGNYTLTYANGQPFPDPPEAFSLSQNAKIVIDSSRGYQTIALEDTVLDYDGVGTVDMILEDSFAVGERPFGNFGTTEGSFNADQTEFDFKLDAPLNNQEYFFSDSIITAASFTEPSPCEVDLTVTRVHYPFSGSDGPAPSDYFTDKYVLQRN